MNKIYRLIRSRATGECSVVSELARSRGKKCSAGTGATTLTVGMAIGGVLMPFSALANCTTVGLTTTCTTDAPTPWTTIIGTGPTAPVGSVLILEAGAQVDTGATVAVSLGDGARITLGEGSLVRNAPTFGSGPWDAGVNTIEFNSDGILTIAAGAQVRSEGTQGQTEAINLIGSNNQIVNYGTVYSRSTPAIWFNNVTTGAANTIDNYGTIETSANGGNANVIGSSNTNDVVFINRTGATVIGNLALGGGNDRLTLEAGSVITGNFEGGGGTNSLTLSGAAGSSDSLDGNINNFQTLIKDGEGQWTLNGTIGNNGGNDPLAVMVEEGTLTLTGNNSHFNGSIQVDTQGTLEGLAQSLPASVDNSGLVRFVQDPDGIYEGVISGVGRVEKAGVGTLTLVGTEAYTGGTTISGGTLQLGNGDTTGSILGDVANNATLAFNRSDDVVFGGAISGAGSVSQVGGGMTTLTGTNTYSGGTTIANGVLRLGDGGTTGSIVGNVANDGALIVNRADALTLAGTISGAGSVAQVGGGVTTLTGTNTYSGGTTIANGVLRLGDGGTTGSIVGNVANDGTLIFNRADAFTYAGEISGTGAVEQVGTGSTTLTGRNTYAGSTTVAMGTLRAGVAGAFSADSAHSVASDATLDLAGFDQTVASLTNTGRVIIGDADSLFPSGSANVSASLGPIPAALAGTTLTVSGDYVGNGGTVVLRTELGDDNSPTDRLVVEGNSSGQTNLRIVNAGGVGAYTSADGIQVVRVAGESSGQFALDGRVVTGLYEYQLFQGGASNSGDGNWYLRNTLPPVDPGTPVDPESPEPPTPIYRPEPFAYLANMTAATDMFQHTLHDRLGEPNYAERSRDGDRAMAGWVRVQGNQMDVRDQDQLGVDIDSWMVQAGVELGNWTAGDSRFHTGLMVGTGKSTTKVDSEVTGHTAIGRVSGNSLGVYGTWYADAEQPTGLYVDSWLQYGRYKNEVLGEQLAKESYDSSTAAASVEAGYAFQLRDNGRSALFLEPQAQAIYSRYRSDDVTERDSGVQVRAGSHGDVTTRVGARLYGHTTNASHNKVQPFVETNWWHSAQGNWVAFNGERMEQSLPKDRYEVKLGAEVKLGGNWTGWGHLGWQTGKEDYRNLDGMIGVKRVW